MLGLAATQAAQGRSQRAVAVAEAANTLSKQNVDGLVAHASVLTLAAVLAMVAELDTD